MADKSYSSGDLVWAKIVGHPWWPGLVLDTSETDDQSNINCKLHVQFFSSPPSHAWTSVKNVHPYKGRDGADCQVGGLYHSTRKTMSSALDKIERAQFLTHAERLKQYSSVGTGIQKIEKPKTVPNKKMSAMKKIKHSAVDLQKSYIVGKTKIPRRWKESFVLMDTADIPEDLRPGQFYNVQETALLKIKEEILDIESDENDINSEDEIIDSDEDPGWSPDDEDQCLMKTNKNVNSKDVDDDDDDEEDDELVDNVDDDSDEQIDDSDEDSSWTPGNADPILKKFTPMKRKSKNQISKQAKSLKTSASKTAPSKSKTFPSKSKTAPSKSKTVTVAPMKPPASVMRSTAGRPSSNLLLIKDNTPTGVQPKPGEFVLEKAVCKDGDIPYLWQFKKGGLIQKYEKEIDQGKELYCNVQNFCDWWACYAHKYQIVKTKLVYRFRNIEKVELVDKPEILPEEISKDFTPAESNTSTTPSTNTTSTTQSQPTSTSTIADSQSTQEQTISSTTSDSNDDSSLHKFQVGSFVLDLKDRGNVDNYPIWKIESHILLKKYEAFVKNAKILHKAVKTYRGYKDIEKHYSAITVKPVPAMANEEVVEVTEDTKPKEEIDSSLEEEYEKNPLLRHFYVYMQVFLSQALEPGFLAEVKKTNDPTYMFPMSEIDKIVEQKKINIDRKVNWDDNIKDTLNKCPYLREVNKPDSSKTCEANVRNKESVKESVFLFGSVYDKETLQQTGSSYNATEFKIGKTAMEYIGTYHQLCHFKYNLYGKCLAKIKLIRDSNDDIPVEKVMDTCLGNKSWVLQNFEQFMNLVEIM